MYSCDVDDYGPPETVKKAHESLSRTPPNAARTIPRHVAFKFDLFAEAIDQLYENLRGIKQFISASYVKRFDGTFNAFECKTSHDLPFFPPIDPRCSQGASKRLYETVRNVGSPTELPADYNDLVQAAHNEGCVSLLTGFEELLSRATLKKFAPNQDRDRLGLPLSEFIIDHLEDLTKDPLRSATLDRLVFSDFVGNQFLPKKVEEVNRNLKEVYAELYAQRMPTDLTAQVKYLSDEKLARHDLLFSQLCAMKAEILKDANWFN
jgi:hypothetical protein